jgi:hypothetical protein
VHQHIIRYKIKPTQVARHEELDRAVHDELARSRPAGLRYATFRLDDGVSFLHLVQEAEDATDSLPSVAAFNEFRCAPSSRSSVRTSWVGAEARHHRRGSKVIGEFARRPVSRRA